MKIKLLFLAFASVCSLTSINLNASSLQSSHEKLPEWEWLILLNNIQSTQAVTKVDVASTNRQSEDIRALAKCLKHNKSVLVIDLSDNRFDFGALLELIRVLRKHPGIKEIYLNKIQLSEPEFSMLIFLAIHNKNIQVIAAEMKGPNRLARLKELKQVLEENRRFKNLW